MKDLDTAYRELFYVDDDEPAPRDQPPTPLSRDELIAVLRGNAERHKRDKEAEHMHNDYALLRYINDHDVTAAYFATGSKWYA